MFGLPLGRRGRVLEYDFCCLPFGRLGRVLGYHSFGIPLGMRGRQFGAVLKSRTTTSTHPIGSTRRW